jgi:hypothetical protein
VLGSADDPSTTLPLVAVSQTAVPQTEDAVAGTKPEEASATLQMPAFQRRLLQAASPAGPTADGSASPAARAVRRLMVTPWFALATGFVVAAGLWVYSPHAELRFPIGAGGEVRCKTPSDCGISSTQNHGLPASAATSPIGGPAATSAGKLRIARRHLTYRVLWQYQGKFAMLVSLSGRRVPHTWRLDFAMPGDQIIRVDGAAWQPSGGSKITVTWPVADAQSQYTAGSGSGDQRGIAPWAKAGSSFVVVAAGVPTTPEYCSFNGARCTFSFAQSAAGQTAPGGP